MSGTTDNALKEADIPTDVDDDEDEDDEVTFYGKLTYTINQQESVFYLKKFRNLLGRSKICDFVCKYF
jgi:hypothetical protein